MAKPIRNPFRFGDPVEGDYYLPRPELTNSIRQFIENRIHVILIGPRRFGKTSFVLNFLKEQESRAQTCLFVDVFNVTSHKDFLQQMIRALRSKRGWGDKLKDWVSHIPKLRPKLSADVDPTTGQSTFSLSTELSADQDIKDTIQDVLSGLQGLGDSVVMAIDEFQRISELEDHGWLEATLRTQMQQLKNTSFLFTGSRKSVIYEMINNPTRPFFRSCQSVDFPAFGEEFTDWIIDRFASVGIQCERGAISELRSFVQDTPNYIQMACFHLVAAGIADVTKRSIKEVLRTIVKQNSYAYQTILNSLTSIQQRSLRLCAQESQQIFSKDFLEKYEIPNAPTLASSIKSLKDKQLLDEGTAKGKVFFDDPLFAIWLKNEFD